MKRFLTLPLLVLLSIPASAQVVVGLTDGRKIEIATPSRGDVDVIVEFREPPLFASERLRASASSVERAAAVRQIEGHFAQLAHDLGGDAVIGQRYERVFAGVSARVSSGALARLRTLGYVAAVHLDRPVHALLDDSVAKIGASKVWSAYGTRGKGVVVAVIDTGIDYRHPALGGKFGNDGRVIGGWDFKNKDADPMDDHGHGTHVAGIIGANGGGLTGVAPEVSFLAYKVLGADGSGFASDIVAAVERAADPDQNLDPADHADVVNMSLGGDGGPDDPITRAVERATAVGVVFAISAGNNGAFYGVGPPGNAPSAITVGASDLLDRMARFSSGGPVDPGPAIKPEVVAPGVDILSLAPNGGTAVHSGTSMAAPHVAGVAALVKSIHPDWTPAQIKAAIVTTAELLPVDVMLQGGGRVDALRAAAVDVLASPSTLSLGRIDAAADRWTTSSSVRLTNTSSARLTLAAQAIGTPNGVSVVIEPATFTLAAGATQPVTITVTADNSAIPWPVQGTSLAFGGAVAFTGGTSPIHVPWAFVKATKISVSYDDDARAFVFITPSKGATLWRTYDFASSGTVDVYTPPGDYQVLLYVSRTAGNVRTDRTIFAPARTTNGDALLALSKPMAATELIYASTDETGRLLSDRVKDPVHRELDYTVLYPPGSSITVVNIHAVLDEKSPPLHFFTSSIPNDYALVGSEWLTDDVSTLYVAQLGAITPAGERTTVGVAASEWRKVPLEVVVPQGAVNAVNGQLQLARMLLVPEAGVSGSSAFTRQVPFSGGRWEGTLYISPERHPSLASAAWVILMTDEGMTIDPPPIRYASEGVVLWPYFRTSPATYVVQPGEAIRLGIGPIHPEATTLMSGGTLINNVAWTGAWGERCSTVRPVTRVTNSRGDAIFDPTSLPDDSYTIEMTIPIAFGGTTGGATLIEQLDSRRNDTQPPSLGLLRVLDSAGMQATVLPPGSGSLQFAISDVNNRAQAMALVPAEKTTAWWRPHFTTEWRPLTPVVVATEVANTPDEVQRLGHPPIGTLFTCDLSGVTLRQADAVDVRIHAEDAEGNAIDYVLAPAFEAMPARRRAAGK